MSISPQQANDHNVSSRYADNFQQQMSEIQSNLKSVKSLTNLYESKQLSVSPPNTSPNASTTGTPQPINHNPM